MTKVKIACDEWYPVFYIVDIDTNTGAVDPIVDISDEEIEAMAVVFDLFEEVQDRLNEMIPDE